MSADPDDEALSWAGDADRHPGELPATPAAVPDEANADGSTADGQQLKPATSSFLLISYGVLGGAYLIWTLGWIISITRSPLPASPILITEIMYQLGEFLAIASGAIWFATVFLLNRKRRAIVRLLWLLIGLAVLIPWPFVLGV
jgi:hypothetical protein